ncbi:unnamed protein product [Rhodiola kirilowii]
MSSLEYMDLSYNNLSGAIPSSLVSLSFLSIFSVAYNQLHGRIPSAGQFLTFPNSSFEGNPGLCSEWSNSPCQYPFEQPDRETSNNNDDLYSLKTSIGVGFATGFAIAIGFSIICHVRTL